MNVKHISTLSSISFSHKHNPHLWICGNWVKKVYFLNCTFSNHYINPTYLTDTEELYITCLRCDVYIIDFSKFSNLKKLYINCFNVKFQNIEHCKKLVEEGKVNFIKSMRTIGGAAEKEILFNMKYAAFEVIGREIMENE
jgi:hypothetical protein